MQMSLLTLKADLVIFSQKVGKILKGFSNLGITASRTTQQQTPSTNLGMRPADTQQTPSTNVGMGLADTQQTPNT